VVIAGSRPCTSPFGLLKNVFRVVHRDNTRDVRREVLDPPVVLEVVFWCKVRVRGRIDEHTTASPGYPILIYGPGLANQVHVGVLGVVINTVGRGRGRRLRRGDKVILIVKRQRHIGGRVLFGFLPVVFE